MLKEIKYFIYFLLIILFFFFSLKFYISNENKKKTFRNLTSIDRDIVINEIELPVITNDTDNIVNYLNNDESSNKKKYSFWDLIK